MNKLIANSLIGYLETLYYLNKNLLKLCGFDAFYSGDPKTVLDIIRDIPIVIPYSYSDNKLTYKKTDGLLEFQAEIEYLKKDYDDILNTNEKTIEKVRKIRNKYEHKLHDIKYDSSGSGSFTLYDISFNINNVNISIQTEELIKLIKPVNILFSKVVQDIRTYAVENEKTSYRYYEKITRFNFNDFNDIYNSDFNLLKKIGNIMNDF